MIRIIAQSIILLMTSPLNPVHDLFNSTLIGIFKTGNGQYHISNRYNHHMCGNSIVACAVAFRSKLQISLCNRKIDLTGPTA